MAVGLLNLCDGEVPLELDIVLHEGGVSRAERFVHGAIDEIRDPDAEKVKVHEVLREEVPGDVHVCSLISTSATSRADTTTTLTSTLTSLTWIATFLTASSYFF